MIDMMMTIMIDNTLFWLSCCKDADHGDDSHHGGNDNGGDDGSPQYDDTGTGIFPIDSLLQ